MTKATFSFLAKPTWQERHVGPHCQYSIDNKKSKTSFWSKSMEKLMIDSELRVSIMESSQKRKFFLTRYCNFLELSYLIVLLLFENVKSRLALDFTKNDACQAYSLRILGTPESRTYLIIRWSNLNASAHHLMAFCFPNWWPVKVGQKKWSTVFFGMRVTVKWVYGVRMCLVGACYIGPTHSKLSWEFQKRLTCHLCVVVSKIRVWKRRDFKQSAIIEASQDLNVFFMSTLGFPA